MPEKDLLKINRKKSTLLFAVMTAIIIVLAAVSLCVGKYNISFEEISGMFASSSDIPDMTYQVFFTLRLPRTLMAITAGAGLGLAGAVYQTIFKNPLASPNLLGVSGGANVGAALAILMVSSSATVTIAAGSFIGGIIAVLCVLILARAVNMNSTTSFILSGIVINAIAGAIIMSLKYFADPMNELASIEYWEMGTLGNITLSKFLSVLPLAAAGFIGIIILRRQIELLSLNDNESRSLGLRLKPVRVAVLLLNTLLVASIVCVTGLISFVGLVAPHISKLILKRTSSSGLALSAMTGAVIVLGADILVRIVYTSEIPISILTTIIGVPILIVFLKLRRKGESR